MSRFTWSTSKDIIISLKECALKEDRTASEVLNDALLLYLDNKKNQQTKQKKLVWGRVVFK